MLRRLLQSWQHTIQTLHNIGLQPQHVLLYTPLQKSSHKSLLLEVGVQHVFSAPPILCRRGTRGARGGQLGEVHKGLSKTERGSLLQWSLVRQDVKSWSVRERS